LREERKGKSCLFKRWQAMRKGLRRLFAGLEGWISLSESLVKTEGKRERDWLSSLAPRRSSSID